MALLEDPVRVTDHRLIYGRPGADKWDQGITSIVRNFSVTQFSITTVPCRGGSCKVRIDYRTPCDPGTNESCYLGEGRYGTGLMSVEGGFYPHCRGNREIVMIVSREISNQSRLAEKEHCLDGIRAYEITLKSADDTIRSVKDMFAAPDRRNTRFATVTNAVRAVRKKLVRHASHPRIAQIFARAILTDGTVSGAFKTDMEALYAEAARLTQKRDSENWHSFRFDPNEYRPYFASCRGYDFVRYDYRKMLMPELLERGGISPSPSSLINI